MPCDSIAIIRARLETSVADEILDPPEASKALGIWLSRQLGATVLKIGVRVQNMCSELLASTSG
jgi:hypothetical protein